MRAPPATLTAAALALLTAPAGGAAGEPVPLDAQANYANGSVLVVRGIEPGPDTTGLEVTLTTADRAVRLNRNASMALVDESGSEYRVVPPPENPELEVPENSRLSGRLVFSGRLRPGTTRLTLSTNQGAGGGSGRYDELPLFRLDIPLDGA